MNWDGAATFLHTDDLDKTHEFYHETLGLRLFKDQGACRIYEVVPGSYLGFCVHFPRPEKKDTILTLLTDDVDGVYDRMVGDQEITVEHAPSVNEKFNIYHFFARDPNGYKVEVQKFLD